MTVKTAQWVFWVSLVLLLPMPFYDQHLAWLPCGSVLKFIVGEFRESNSVSLTGLLPQLVFGLLVCGCLAKVYGFFSAGWPSTIRGSVMSLLVFSCLIIFSSVPVYGSLSPSTHNESPLRTFLEIY
jgi:hypothetical protein